MPKGVYLTEEQKRKIEENKENPFVGQLARELGVSRNCVRNHLKRLERQDPED